MFNAVPYDARPFDGTQVNVPVPPGLLLPVSWFLVLQPTSVLGSAALGPFRDDDAFMGSDIADPATSIVGLLEATGEFDRVTYSKTPSRARTTSQEGKVAMVRKTRFQERNEGSQRRKNRTVFYEIAIEYRAEEVEVAEREADRLNAVVQNAIAPVALGGFTKPWLNTITAGVPSDIGHPAYSLTLAGSFSWSYETSGGLRATD
jgi:hypothetical protein